MSKKCIMLLLDGLGDRSYPALNDQTPLQAAHTPTLDHLACNGANGLYHAAALGQALPSENAHFAMFGYDMIDFPGRGALEALGAGIPMDMNQVAILSHFVAVRPTPQGTLILEEGKPKATEHEIKQLIDCVGYYAAPDGTVVQLHHTSGFRGILTLTGHVSPFVTDSDPMVHQQPVVAVVPWAAHTNDAATCNCARVLYDYLVWVHHQLRDHPVNVARRKAGHAPLNGLVTQRAGQLKNIEPMAEKYGLRAMSIASGIVYHGLAAYLGMTVYKVKDTDRPGDDLARRLQSALDELKDHDFIHVHTKTPDEAAHTKNPLAKRDVIERLDKGLAAVLKQLLADPELLLIVAADHSTPSAGPLIHSGEPVPLIFYGPGIRRDTVTRFDEIHAAPGALGMVRGKELMYLILNHLDRAKLHGIMDTPVDQPYYPGHVESFRITIGKV